MPIDDYQPTAVDASTESGASKQRVGAHVAAVLSSVFVRLGEALTAGLRGAGIGGRHGLAAGRMLGSAFGQAVDMLVSLLINIADAAIPGPPVSRLFPSRLFRLVYGAIGAACGLAVGIGIGLAWGFISGLLGAAPLAAFPTGDPASRWKSTGLGPGPMRPGPGPGPGHGPGSMGLGPGPMGPGRGSMAPGPMGPGPGPVGPRWGDARGPFLGVAPGRRDGTFGPVSGRQLPGEPRDGTNRPAPRRPRRLDRP